MMVKSAFANIDVQVWLHHGRLGESELSACLFHSSPHLGGEILDALGELDGSESPNRRTLTFLTRGAPKRLKRMRLALVDETKRIACDEHRRNRRSRRDDGDSDRPNNPPGWPDFLACWRGELRSLAATFKTYESTLGRTGSKFDGTLVLGTRVFRALSDFRPLALSQLANQFNGAPLALDLRRQFFLSR